MRRPITQTTERPAATPRTVRKPITKGSDVGAAGPYQEQHLNKGPHPEGVQPYCTCSSVTGGFTFDQQIGIYVHSGCWKPSRAYYLAAKEAGIITTKEH